MAQSGASSELASHLDSECEWLVANDVVSADVVMRNRQVAEAALRPWTPVFIHGDLQIVHVFVDGDEVTGVVDWSEGGQGDAMYDLATLTLAHEEHLDDVIAGYGGDVEIDVIRACWSLRCLMESAGWSSTDTARPRTIPRSPCCDRGAKQAGVRRRVVVCETGPVRRSDGSMCDYSVVESADGSLVVPMDGDRVHLVAQYLDPWLAVVRSSRPAVPINPISTRAQLLHASCGRRRGYLQPTCAHLASARQMRSHTPYADSRNPSDYPRHLNRTLAKARSKVNGTSSRR